MKLYGYWRSSAAWRVRIACALKGLDVTHVPVNLRDGAQHGPDHRARNPMAALPVLELEDGRRLTQSLAILGFLDGEYPDPPLLPADRFQAARARAIALAICCDIHPVQNLRVLQALEARFGADAPARTAWAADFIATGLAGVAALVDEGDHCIGGAISVADLCLVPQLYNARRFGLDVGAWPRLARIEAACLAHPAFARTAPENQPDAPPR